MTDPTPKPWWPPHAARRHVQEPTPDAAPADPPTWPEDAVQEVALARQVAMENLMAAHREKARAERAEAEVERLQGEVSAEEVHADGAECPVCTHLMLVDQIDRAERAESNARVDELVDDLRAILDAPQSEAGGDDE